MPEKIAFYFSGSDLEEYPYYLLSAEQMRQKENFDWLTDYINGEFGDTAVYWLFAIMQGCERAGCQIPAWPCRDRGDRRSF
ncbi:hypothetical protein [uncultured Dysosmobacter sp.]|uniref:hypothetical protein n=1 Tax=uncultured Dysosmobacter sp. TaxID=2591384 RepID=UPI00262130D8|nr:hypothetical protein [uncultured Dysosmobacter sp.]